MKSTILKFLVCLFIVSFAFTACKKDKIFTDSSAELRFSADSIMFDTVFTSIGSTTKLFKIHNPYKQKLNISKAYIASGSNSPFRINIDGDSGPSLENIEILPEDSLFVFVQVTVNPNGINSPLLIKDSIIFLTNGNSQKVLLTAVGQDVHLHKPTVFPTDGSPAYSIIDCSSPWIDDKPHLLFGHAVVSANNTLNIEKGTRLYMNTGAVLQVNEGATIKINGTKDSIITIQGARLEQDYKDIAGQWDKIWLKAGSKNNEINWVKMINGNIGVQADSLGTSGNAQLNINNTIITNMSSAALYSRNGHIRSYNCVFANCGQYLALLVEGGNYTFQHVTFANYWSSSNRSTSAIAISNYNTSNGNTYTGNLDSAYFGNCIIDGNLSNEVVLEQSSSAVNFNYKFENCIIKTTLNMANDGVHYNTVYKNVSPDFKDIDNNDFQLKGTSAAIDKGFSSFIIYDLNNLVRPNPNTSIPDLGAYEYY